MLCNYIDSVCKSDMNLEILNNKKNNLYDIFYNLGFSTTRFGLNSFQTLNPDSNMKYFSVDLVDRKNVPNSLKNDIYTGVRNKLIDMLFESRMDYLITQYSNQGYIDVENSLMYNLFVESALNDFNRENVLTTPFLIYSINEIDFNNALGTGTTFISNSLKDLPLFEYLNKKQENIVEVEIRNFFKNRKTAKDSIFMEIGRLAGNPNIKRKSFSKIAFNKAYVHAQYQNEILDKIVLCSDFETAQKYELFGSTALKKTKIQNVDKIESSFIASTLEPINYERKKCDLYRSPLDIIGSGGFF